MGLMGNETFFLQVLLYICQFSFILLIVMVSSPTLAILLTFSKLQKLCDAACFSFVQHILENYYRMSSAYCDILSVHFS